MEPEVCSERLQAPSTLEQAIQDGTSSARGRCLQGAAVTSVMSSALRGSREMRDVTFCTNGCAHVARNLSFPPSFAVSGVGCIMHMQGNKAL